MQRALRMKKEIQMLNDSPPHGISCWPKNDSLDTLEAQILGGTDTPYEDGVFKLDIQIPDRYPFEPPKVRFITPIYHPNIDSGGRICLDTLKMPPKGAWKPCLNISTVLTSIQLLMAEPNPEDPLMTDISDEFQYSRAIFVQHAKEWTQKHAKTDKQIYNNAKEEQENLSLHQGKTVTGDSERNKRPSTMSDITNKKLKC